MKTTWVLPAIGAALLLTGCGDHRENDRNDYTEPTRPYTDRADDRREGGVMSEAVEDGKEMASDAAQNGKELASDVIEDGKELASDVAGGVRDNLTDGDGTYRTDEDGRVHDK